MKKKVFRLSGTPAGELVKDGEGGRSVEKMFELNAF